MYEVPYFFSINVSGMFPSVTDAWRYRWAYGKRRIGKRKTSTIFFFFRLVVRKTQNWKALHGRCSGIELPSKQHNPTLSCFLFFVLGRQTAEQKANRYATPANRKHFIAEMRRFATRRSRDACDARVGLRRTEAVLCRYESLE